MKLAAPPSAKKRTVTDYVNPVLNRDNHIPEQTLPLREICLRVVALAQVLKEKKFYPYQVDLAYRIVESLLDHDGETVTSLMSRQAGKTETIGAIVAAIAVIVPSLAKQFPNDWRLNLTDEKGVYRGFAHGVKIGIYAPRLDQSGIMFDRTKQALETDTAKKVLRELNISLMVFNGNTVKLSNHSRVLCQSASEQSKIEGETHHLLVVEEAQDVGDLKLRKSLRPMVAATGGTIVMVGTASTRKCDFYMACRHNQRVELVTQKRNHFFFPYTVGIQYNSLYRKHIEQEKIRLGEDSDEFRMSYGAEWIFERGMFVTQEQLFHRDIAQTNGLFSAVYPFGLPQKLRYYSIVLGIDWGSASDSTVLTFLAVDWNNPLDSGYASNANGMFHYQYFQKHVVGWVEFLGDDYETQFHAVHEAIRTFKGLSKVVTDSNTCGLPIYDRLVAVTARTGIEVEPFNFQARLKSDGYKSLYGDICARRLTFPAAPVVRASSSYRKFVNQMLDAQKVYDNGLMKVSHPDEKDAHDDYPDSLMMAAWGANTPARSNRIDISMNNPFYR